MNNLSYYQVEAFRSSFVMVNYQGGEYLWLR